MSSASTYLISSNNMGRLANMEKNQEEIPKELLTTKNERTLTSVQPYINYEEKLLVDKVEKDKGSDKKDVKGCDERTKKGTRGNYTTF
jgi:hypothetical protein